MVQCEVCGAAEPQDRNGDSPGRRICADDGWYTKTSHNHTMVVLSVFNHSRNKRDYHDFCSLKCAKKWIGMQSRKATTTEIEVTPL